MFDAPNTAIRNLQVYPASALRAVWGQHEGSAIGLTADLCLDDLYRLTATAQFQDLRICSHGADFEIAKGSRAGRAGNDLFVDGLAVFMTPNGKTVEILILAECKGDHLDAIWLLPIEDLEPKQDYRLVRSTTDSVAQRLNDVTAAGVVAGTGITMADGSLRPVEALRPGDLVLCRQSGPQPLRMIQRETLRATGRFAPIKLNREAFDLTADLLVSPNQMLFVNQAPSLQSLGCATALLSAGELTRGHGARRSAGGHVDYLRLGFDQPEVIFAEGLATLCSPMDAAQPEQRAKPGIKTPASTEPAPQTGSAHPAPQAQVLGLSMVNYAPMKKLG